jgi:acetylornithine deacetylase/succinyl-diaminopimelate desuccinylase-like protein
MDESLRQAAIEALDQGEAVKLVKQLVDIPSPEGEELECARFLYGYMREAGIETVDTGMGVIEPAVTVGAIDGGWPYAPSTVPGVCHLYVNLRTTPAWSGKQALAELDARIRELAAERPNLKYDLEVYLSNEPSTVTSTDSLLVRTAVKVMEERMGFPTRPFARGEGNASNDTNTFRRHGIPAIKCGPNVRTEPNGAEMNREHGTHVAKGDLTQAARFYLHMACELSGRKRQEFNEKET